MSDDSQEPMSNAVTVPAHEVGAHEILGAGAQVGDYLVEELRALGGFAAIYRTTHLPSRRAAAVKVLHRYLATSPKILRRFQREVRLVNKLHHPNIIEVYEFGTHSDGRPFFAMEWLDGRNLEEEVKARGRFSPPEALRILDDLCSALGAAHDIGVIHRDLKAPNVIAVPRGDWYAIKLVDFGIAKLVDPEINEATMLTTTGVRLGSPHTMAPEQILGGVVDVRTDVYAVGVLLYELLTGALPFQGASVAEVEDMHLEASPPRPSAAAPVSRHLDSVVLRCLAQEPARRYPSIADFMADLGAAVGRGA